MQDQPEMIDQYEQTHPVASPGAEPLTWHAPEGVSGVRGAGWYIGFAVVLAGLMALAIFVFRSVTFAILLPVMGVAIVLPTSKQPRTINYSISPKGIYVGDKLHDFSEFRAFGVIQEPELSSAIILPVKRFSPGLTIYFRNEDGERIVDMLGTRLPIQEVKLDSLEKLIRLIRL